VRLAYVNTEQPATNARPAIERVQAEPVDLVVTAVSLIKMHRDRRMYEWQRSRLSPGPARLTHRLLYRLHPRPLAAAEQLGQLDGLLQAGRLRAADAGLARRSRNG
jgi:hypothetical protein